MKFQTLVFAVLLVPLTLPAQQRDTAVVRRDSVARADSIARTDSIRLVEELERQRGATAAPQGSGTTAQGPTNARLLPDISAVGDFVADLSPNGSTQEDGTRLGVREVEIAVQAAVDPYFRGDVFLGMSDVEGLSIEQAFLTTTSIPNYEIRLGRFLMPFGKENTTHRHEVHAVEYPWIIQRFLGAEGLKATGVGVSRIFSPFGFYQEVLLTVADRFGDAPEGDVRMTEPINRHISGLTFAGRLRNYWDLSENSNVELSGSYLAGRREQPLVAADSSQYNYIAARQQVAGVDFTFRWRPLQQGLYRSFLLRAEAMRQINNVNPSDPSLYAGPLSDFNGGYVFARVQLTQRLYFGGRFDALQDPVLDNAGGTRLFAGQGVLEYYPSEFSKLIASYERLHASGGTTLDNPNRILLQATFALGPHRPHPF